MVNQFISNLKQYAETSTLNRIAADVALDASYAGVQLFRPPIFAFGDPYDPLFEGLKSEKAIGSHYKMPLDWNPAGKTVVSIFFPFTQEIISSNGENYDFPSDLWLHGRIEGQAYINDFADFVVRYLEQAGYPTVAPGRHPDFFSVDQGESLTFTSNWSERHAAFICGMGTFALTKGIITEEGTAGRLVSFITTADFPKTQRSYQGLYDNCTMCGLCIQRCPAHAISLSEGKNHLKCFTLIETIKKKTKPRYGCGKCQINLPCTSRNPRQKA